MTKLPTLSSSEAINLAWKNKFNLSGRARRSEFWWNILQLGVVFTLCSIAAFIVLVIIRFFKGHEVEERIDVYLWLALELLALISVAVYSYPLLVRRLHDVGKSGRWAVIQTLFGWTLPLWLFFCYVLGELVTEIGRFPFAGDEIQNFWDCVFAFLFYVSPFCAIIGIVSTIYLCVLCVRDSQKEENQYGPSPKYVEE